MQGLCHLVDHLGRAPRHGLAANLSRGLKCCADGEVASSGAVSEAIVSAVFTPIAGIAVRSTPVARRNAQAVAHSIAVRLACLLTGAFDMPHQQSEASAGPGERSSSEPSSGGVRLSICAAICLSHVTICSLGKSRRWMARVSRST